MGQADLILGDPYNNPLFHYDTCHGHYHFEDFAEYRLLDTNGVRVATGHKVGFCLLDFMAWDPNAAPEYVYECDYQGIQRGWSDIYMSSLPCQWIDITGLPGGTYILELEVDPENRIAESDESNNITRVLVSFPDCPPPPNDEFESAQVITAAIDTGVGGRAIGGEAVVHLLLPYPSFIPTDHQGPVVRNAAGRREEVCP